VSLARRSGREWRRFAPQTPGVIPTCVPSDAGWRCSMAASRAWIGSAAPPGGRDVRHQLHHTALDDTERCNHLPQGALAEFCQRVGRG